MSQVKTSRKLRDRIILWSLVLAVLVVGTVYLVYVQAIYASEITGLDEPIHTLRDLNQAYVNIADRVRPTVVTVSTERVMPMSNMAFGDMPFLEYFFGNPNGRQQQPQREYHQKGLGSGVIIKPDGLILTNNHVVDGADSIYVRTLDGKRYTATIVGVDAQTDIAVLQIPADDLPSLPIANSDELQVGEIVLAVGSPMSENLAYTVTQGIVSATGRSNVGLADYEDFIQTDAAINPGNSGGPLVNLDGELVGINTAIASRSGGFQGIGFAVPSNMAMRVMNSLVSEGRVVRGWLGISIQDVNENLAAAMNLDVTGGALVGDVLPDSPAARAHLKPGDLIVSMDDQQIQNMAQLRNRVAASRPGTEIDLDILRNGERKSVTVTLGEMPKTVAQGTNNEDLNQLLGFQTEDVSPALADQVDVPTDTPGVIVTIVDPTSNAYQAGLRQGDVIREFNHKAVEDESAFTSLAGDVQPGSNVLLRVQRRDGALYLAFQV